MRRKKILYYVSEISQHKGCHTLIKAFQDIEQQISSFRLILVGRELDVEIPEDEKL